MSVNTLRLPPISSSHLTVSVQLIFSFLHQILNVITLDFWEKIAQTEDSSLDQYPCPPGELWLVVMVVPFCRVCHLLTRKIEVWMAGRLTGQGNLRTLFNVRQSTENLLVPMS